MTAPATASAFADAVKRFGQTYDLTSGGWDDQVGRQVRTEHCQPLEAEAAALQQALEDVAQEVTKAKRMLR